MVLDTAKLKQAYGLSFREAGTLLPLLVLFGFGMFAVSALVAPFVPVAVPGRPLTFSLSQLLAVLVLMTAATVHFILRIWLFRARSLGLPVDAALFARGVRQGLLPVLGVAWAAFWRSFVAIVLVLTPILLIDSGTAGPSGSLLFGPIVLFALFALAAIVSVYLLPFVFVTYLRTFHPTIGFKDALGRMRGRVKGRRLELVATLLVASLPLLIAPLVLKLFVGLGPWLFLISVPLMAAATLPGGLTAYLYYEEFETLEGLHPEPVVAREPFE